MFVAPEDKDQRGCVPWNRGLHCGCLTQIHDDPDRYGAWTPELTKEIVADDRIPTQPGITPENLPVFAEWQRKVDAALNREPPVWVD